jgi:twitching motility protein PilT
MEENTQKQTTQSAEVIRKQTQEEKITLDQLVNLAIEKEASDIHFGEGSRISLRVGGQFVFIENVPVLSKKNADEMIFALLGTEAERKRLEQEREIDFSYKHSTGVGFRVNVFYQRGKLSAVMRMVSKHLPTMDELGIPEEMKKFLAMREGLILVTGTAGSGKSTSIQAMLEYVNENFVHHVITIENPIEYVFEDKKSFFSQREVGKDTLTMANALSSAIREDPNIIMVSDITDLKTLDSILTVVETGHLVISAMPTKDVKQTLERMVSMYPQNEQEQAQDRIADSLIAIMSQDLLNRIDRTGRAAVYELLIANPGIRNIIRHKNFNQLRTAIQSGAKEGMITMDTYAYQLAEQGIISQNDLAKYTEQE